MICELLDCQYARAPASVIRTSRAATNGVVETRELTLPHRAVASYRFASTCR